MAIYLRYMRPEKKTTMYSAFKRYLIKGDIVKLDEFIRFRGGVSFRVCIPKALDGWMPADLACFDYVPKKDYARYRLS